jgi:hypothetical protein
MFNAFKNERIIKSSLLNCNAPEKVTDERCAHEIVAGK